ncbi:hypothetical protein SAMN04487957_10588 [Halomonas shengliensis]|uniref:Prophage minor tail protein Z (GPZ) n=1 Tax=Halomonas shengliensis TaxID=419597 RepID=A0A1H0IEF0_9GAMM|nr:hypothetical protein [Halomonas shengliensis]SDO29745.1 hypothetical protein SAMN04487957_10588 [Halomonas shengliensis]
MARARGRNSKLPKGIEVGGLAESKKAFEALPAATRRAIVGAVNEQAAETRKALIKRISEDGRVNQREVGKRIRISKAKASEGRAFAELKLSRAPVRFKHWQYDTRVQDSTGTRASIWVRKGGQRMRVWGFVNPKGRGVPLTRMRKGNKDRIRRAAGWGLKNHWNHQVNDQLRDEIATGVDGKFLNRFNKEWAKRS